MTEPALVEVPITKQALAAAVEVANEAIDELERSQAEMQRLSLESSRAFRELNEERRKRKDAEERFRGENEARVLLEDAIYEFWEQVSRKDRNWWREKWDTSDLVAVAVKNVVASIRGDYRG